MVKKLIMILVLCFITVSLSADWINDYDGNEWKSWTRTEKIYFVRGLLLGMYSAAWILETVEGAVPEVLMENIPWEIKISTIVTGVDTFYLRSDYESIPVWVAVINYWRI